MAGEPEGDIQPDWDRERYTAQIEEPDWWMPEESVWAESTAPGRPESPELPIEMPDEPGGPDDEALTTEVSSGSIAEPVEEPTATRDTEPSTSPPTEPKAPAPAGSEAAPAPASPNSGQGDAYLGEETMLWFGRRPESAESPGSEDAAGEMEVASTGGRRTIGPPAGAAMPGGQELDEALAAFDSSGARRGPIRADVEVSAGDQAAAEAPARPGIGPSADPASSASGDLRSPASRAYRRLRRIFPG